MDEKIIEQIAAKVAEQVIKKELADFKQRNLSFRSWLKLDRATDSYTVSNKQNVTGSGFLPAAGGEITGDLKIDGKIGFYGTTVQAKQTVSGSRGSNAALQSLLTALATLGLITDSSS